MENMRRRLSALYDPDMMGESGRYGHVSGYPVGSNFASRKACSDARVHRPSAAGIGGSVKEGGAESVCISKGYEDDKDEGDFILYTGTGGQVDPFSITGKQTSGQTFVHPHNAALALSCDNKRPVRVIRGPNEGSTWAPVQGYRYDGLYLVQKYYMDKGVSGYDVCRYELRRIPGQPAIPRKPSE